MQNNKLGILLMVFISILVGIVLLNSLADNIYLATTISGVTNESITMSSGTAGTVTNESITMASQIGSVANCGLATITFFGNATNSTHLANVAINTDVNITGNRSIIVSALHFPADGDYNISYTYTPYRTGSTEEDDLTSVAFFGNATDSTHSSSVAVGTQVNWTKAGTVTTSSCYFGTGNYNITYNYEGDEYLTNTTAQTLITLVILFFTLTIIIVGYLFVKKGFEDIL